MSHHFDNPPEVHDTEELTGLRRRYAHLHTPTHLTNPDHLVWQREPSTAESGEPRLHVAARFSGTPEGQPEHANGPRHEAGKHNNHFFEDPKRLPYYEEAAGKERRQAARRADALKRAQSG